MDSDSENEQVLFDADHYREIVENEEFGKIEVLCEVWKTLLPEIELIGSSKMYELVTNVFEYDGKCEKAYPSEDQEQFYDALLDVFVDKDKVDQELYTTFINTLHHFYEKKKNGYFVTKTPKTVCPPSLIRYPPLVNCSEKKIYNRINGSHYSRHQPIRRNIRQIKRGSRGDGKTQTPFTKAFTL